MYVISSAWSSFGNTSGVNLGRTTNGSFYFKGAMDEVRIESLTRSSNWIWASWMTAASNATWTAYSAINPRPLLRLAADGKSLTWPGDAGPFTLYMATNLVAPVTWLPLTNPPAVLSNGCWHFFLPTQGSAASFFRLQQ